MNRQPSEENPHQVHRDDVFISELVGFWFAVYLGVINVVAAWIGG